MKKNAFTLAELMGVVIILGVILLLTLPTIDKTIKNTRQTAYDAQVNNIIKAAADWTLKNPDLLPTEDGNSIIIYLGELKRNGDIPIDLKNPKTKKVISNNTSVVITKNDTKYEYDVDIVDATGNEDNNSPILVINGDVVDYVEINQEGIEYVVPTASAKAADGTIIPASCISYQILKDDNVVSRVDTSKLGTYTLNYTVTYQEKTSNYQKKVVVRDTTNPEINIGNNLNILSNNMDENLLAGVNVTDNSGENIIPTVKSNVSNIDGIYSVYYTATDSSGNSITKKREVTVSTPVPNEIYKEDILAGNDPKKNSELIPVEYNNDGWVVANEYEDWYDYSNRKWANVIIVNSNAKENYVPGYKVNMNDVYAFLVWIPRFKSTITPFNNTDTTPISIEFVDKTQKADAAFTIGGKELSGFWIGKFEASGTSLKTTIIPNATSLTNIPFGDIFKSGYLYIHANDYDTHLSLGTEWGAVAYLTQSFYGRCHGICEKMYMNNTMTTGMGSSTKDGTAGAYDTPNGMKASTTGNIYGVYDMAGGFKEFVASINDYGYAESNMPAAEGYSSNPSVGFGELDNNDLKSKGKAYINSFIQKPKVVSSVAKYLYPSIYRTSEITDATSETKGYWGSVSTEPSAERPFFTRGGNLEDENASIFTYDGTDGLEKNISFRLSLVEAGFDPGYGGGDASM